MIDYLILELLLLTIFPCGRPLVAGAWVGRLIADQPLRRGVQEISPGVGWVSRYTSP